MNARYLPTVYEPIEVEAFNVPYTDYKSSGGGLIPIYLIEIKLAVRSGGQNLLKDG
jgi:hypothetical protein